MQKYFFSSKMHDRYIAGTRLYAENADLTGQQDRMQCSVAR